MNRFKSLLLLSFILLVQFFSNNCIAQDEPKTGPVFENIGAVYEVPEADYVPDSSKILKPIFDIDAYQNNPADKNFIISSLHRFYNMHVKRGIKESNIHLAFVVHGTSTKDVLNNEAYNKIYAMDNPNYNLIKTLSEQRVGIYVCGQSALSSGYQKSDLMPEVKMALSAMTVLTTYQMDGYAMIKF